MIPMRLEHLINGSNGLRTARPVTNSKDVCCTVKWSMDLSGKVYEDERSISIQFVCKLDERPRIGGCIERRGSREAYVDRTGLSGWR